MYDLTNTLEEKMEEIEKKLKNGNIQILDFKDLMNNYKEAGNKIKELLEWGSEIERDNKDLSKLYYQIAGYKASELIDDLRSLGYALSKENEIKKSFESQGYRLLEQVRSCRKEEVFHNILRIFISRKKEVPLKLVEAFKPIYSDNLFKIFLFSFLSGILGKEIE